MSPARDFDAASPTSGVQAKRAWERYDNDALLLRDKDGNPSPTYGNFCLLARKEFGQRLSYNVMAETPLLDEVPLSDADVGAIRELFERRHAIAFGDGIADKGLRHICSEQSFHPVQRYLTRLLGEWDGEPRIARVLTEILGAADKALHQTFIRVFFISAVARALEPGCKVDTVLVLQGPQGAKKSSFFNTLADPWFADTPFDFTTNKGLLTFGRAWLYEWGEIERVLLTRENADVKSFVTSRVDTFVPPYGRAPIEHRRSTILVGSSNVKTLLADPTGARRYHIIQTSDNLNLSLLAQWKDQLWAEAIEEYTNGRQWHLDRETEREQAEDAERWQVHDGWREPVLEFLSRWHRKPRDLRDPEDALTSARIAFGALALEGGKFGKREQMQLAALLHQLGYERVKKHVGSGSHSFSAWIWVCPSTSAEEASHDPLP